MNSKTKALLSIILFIALMGGLKLFYDSRTENKVLAGLEGDRSTSNTTAPSGTRSPETGKGTAPSSQAADTAAGTQGRQTLPLPDITVYDGGGSSIKLSSFRGKKLVINAWASWCGPCKAEMPDFAELDKEASDYQIVMINIPGGLETRENSDRFLKDNGLVFTNMLYDEDLEFARALEITSIPTSIFVDADGNIHYYQQGMLTKEQVKSALESVE